MNAVHVGKIPVKTQDAFVTGLAFQDLKGVTFGPKGAFALFGATTTDLQLHFFVKEPKRFKYWRAIDTGPVV